MIIIIIVMIIILLVVQLLSLLLLLLLLLLSLLPSSSSFFCVSECFLTGVWLFFFFFFLYIYPICFSGQAVYPLTAIKPSSRSSSFFYFFILSTFTQSFLFFIRFLLRSVAVRRVRSNKIKWYYLATEYASKIVTNIFARVIKRRGQIKKELFLVGSVWENICVNTDISIKWQ